MKVEQNKWVEELGKFLLDVGKYVLTAVVITSFLSDKADSWLWMTFATIFTIAMVLTGLLLIKFANHETTRKK